MIKRPYPFYRKAAVTLHAVYRIGIQSSSDIYTLSPSVTDVRLTDKKDRTKSVGYKHRNPIFSLDKKYETDRI